MNWSKPKAKLHQKAPEVFLPFYAVIPPLRIYSKGIIGNSPKASVRER